MKTFEEVADKFGLNGKRKDLYLKYMKARWQEMEEIICITNYASQWASMFKEGIEYQVSDEKGKKILKKLYRKEKI